VPDPACTADHAVQPRAGAACESGAERTCATGGAACAHRPRVRELPRGAGRVGARQGRVARREEARSSRAVAAGRPAEQVAGNLAPRESAAAAHAGTAGAARLVGLAATACGRCGWHALRAWCTMFAMGRIFEV